MLYILYECVINTYDGSAKCVLGSGRTRAELMVASASAMRSWPREAGREMYRKIREIAEKKGLI